MSSKTKIIVLRMKELVYTGIFILLGILLILLLVIMFSPGKNESTDSDSAENAVYQPGIYTTSIRLGENAVDLEIITDSTSVSSIRLVSLNETVAAMYPLMEPSLENITRQILAGTEPENVTYPEENRYTSRLILEAIEMTLNKAVLPQDPTQ